MQDHPIILVLIDGDGNIFCPELILQGHAGGRQAAMLLNQGITEYAALVDQGLANRGRLWLSLFCNKEGLAETLVSHGLCSAEEFINFCIGFNQSSPFFSLIDCGPGKEAADTKIKEFLKVFTQFPQTALVVFGGSHDNGYTSTLTSLENLGLLGKVVLLQGYDELASEIKNLKLPVLQLEKIFMARKITGNPSKRQELIKLPIQSGPIASPEYKPPLDFDLENINGFRSLEPNIPINKQNPPPCTFFYLAHCLKGSQCRYGHDYSLTEQNWVALRAYAKKWPCSELLKGRVCPLDEDCFSSHYCPNGQNCTFFSKGKCKFTKAFMHTNPVVAHDSESESISTSSTT